MCKQLIIVWICSWVQVRAGYLLEVYVAKVLRLVYIWLTAFAVELFYLCLCLLLFFQFSVFSLQFSVFCNCNFIYTEMQKFAQLITVVIVVSKLCWFCCLDFSALQAQLLPAPVSTTYVPAAPHARQHFLCFLLLPTQLFVCLFVCWSSVAYFYM